MMKNSKKKKWHDTWWGLLWTLAIVDANPGRGLRVFMEVDKDMEDLTDFHDGLPVRKPSWPKERKRTRPWPAEAPSYCRI